jgi:hypothetical protein
MGITLLLRFKKQHELIQTILNHWEGDHGNEYNPDRQSALSFIRLANSVEEAQAEIEKETQNQPFTTVTGANFESYDGTEDDLAAKLKVDNKPLFLLFGTGWGLHASITDQADYKLEPLFGCAKMDTIIYPCVQRLLFIAIDWVEASKSITYFPCLWSCETE